MTKRYAARKIKLTREERTIEENIEKFVPVDKEEFEQIAKSRFNNPAAKIISGRKLRKKLGV